MAKAATAPKAKPRNILGPVPEREFLDAIEFVQNTIKEEPSEESDMIRVLAILWRKYDPKSVKPPRIFSRMSAMVDLMEHPLFKAWNIGKSDDGAVLVHRMVMRVAARFPLGPERMAFDAERFYAEVLRRSRKAGKA